MRPWLVLLLVCALCRPAGAAEEVDTGSAPLSAAGAISIGVFSAVTALGAAAVMGGASLLDSGERNTPRAVQWGILGTGVAVTAVGGLGMLSGVALIGLDVVFAE